MTTELSMQERIRLAVIAFSVLGASAAIAAQLEPPESARGTLAAVDGTQNVLGALRSNLIQSGVPSPAEMAARAGELQAALDDPEGAQRCVRSDVPKFAATIRNWPSSLAWIL